jgi:hypothetical protein
MPQHGRRITLKLQDVSTNHRIKWLTECHCGGITFGEGYVRQRFGSRALPSNLKYGRRPINTYDFAVDANNVGGEERDVTGAAANVKDPHPGHNSSLLK